MVPLPAVPAETAAIRELPDRLRELVAGTGDISRLPAILARLIDAVRAGHEGTRAALWSPLSQPSEEPALRALCALALALAGDPRIRPWAVETLRDGRVPDALVVALGLVLSMRPVSGEVDVAAMQELLIAPPIRGLVLSRYFDYFRSASGDAGNSPPGVGEEATALGLRAFPRSRYELLVGRVEDPTHRDAVWGVMERPGEETIVLHFLPLLEGASHALLPAEIERASRIVRSRRDDVRAWAALTWSLSVAFRAQPEQRRTIGSLCLEELRAAGTKDARIWVVKCMAAGRLRKELLDLLGSGEGDLPVEQILSELLRGNTPEARVALERGLAGDWGASAAALALRFAVSSGQPDQTLRARRAAREWLSSADAERRRTALDVIPFVAEVADWDRVEQLSVADADAEVRDRARRALAGHRMTSPAK